MEAGILPTTTRLLASHRRACCGGRSALLEAVDAVSMAMGVLINVGGGVPAGSRTDRAHPPARRIPTAAPAVLLHAGLVAPHLLHLLYSFIWRIKLLLVSSVHPVSVVHHIMCTVDDHTSLSVPTVFLQSLRWSILYLAATVWLLSVNTHP